MLPADVKSRVEAVVDAVSVPIGFHAHAILDSPLQTALQPSKPGPRYLDGTCRGLGAGAGNAQTRGNHRGFAQGRLSRPGSIFTHHGCCGRHSGTNDAQAPGHSEASLIQGYAGVYFELSCCIPIGPPKSTASIREISSWSLAAGKW